MMLWEKVKKRRDWVCGDWGRLSYETEWPLGPLFDPKLYQVISPWFYPLGLCLYVDTYKSYMCHSSAQEWLPCRLSIQHIINVQSKGASWGLRDGSSVKNNCCF